VTGSEGEVVHAGPDGLGAGLKALAAGRKIRYEGVIGPIAFDQYGDITGPFRLWRIKDGEVVTEGEMSDADVAALKRQIAG
jgi:branched-chain amino acid transport system substrate-binding protein